MPKSVKQYEHRIVTACILVLLMTLVGCHFTETLWSSRLASPDGKRLALAQTDNTDTIGNVEHTIVRIKEDGSWRRSKMLVVFDNGIDHEEDFHMKWDSPSHVDIVVRGYGPAPAYRAMDPGSPVTFSVHYVQKPYQPTL